jgi:EAL domain-containing protein (putative c-di-GMP-specific phosphodiesterase class I)/ActR/RegA family two-component response regulator
MRNVGNILVIDDEADVGEFICAAATGLELRCVATTDVADLPRLCTPETTLILLDLMMAEVDGIEVMRLLSGLKCEARIVLMSGISKRVLETAEKLGRALGLSVVGHLVKPFRLAELEDVLKTHATHEGLIPIKRVSEIFIPEGGLRRALDNNEFELYYQPQIEIATEKVLGLEALIRWQHPIQGLIYPDDFIGRAEATGLIDELGWMVANRGMSEFKQFANDGLALPRLALNVSVHSLRDLGFPDNFLALTEKHDVPLESVIIEITESGLIDQLSRTLDVLTRLRLKNVQLSIDDFGTGYAMMQQLVNIPATELKIDKLFVMNMDVNGSDRVMVQKTIEIGHELGMKVMAEGVETKAQLEYLRLKGCDSAQGYFFSRPLPLNQMVSWLEAYRARQEH